MNILQKVFFLSFVLFFLLGISRVYASDYIFKQTYIQIDNNATVDNTVYTNSNTGANTQITNEGTSTLQTGNAGAQTIICNDVNHTVINGNNPADCPPSQPTPTKTPGTQPIPTPGSGGSTGGSGSSGNSSGGGGSNTSSTTSQNQGVLGATTMAATGTFTETIVNIITLLGGGFFLLGMLQRIKKLYIIEFEFSY